MLLSVYVQIFGYYALNVQCTAILFDNMNPGGGGSFSLPSPPSPM